ncbi:MAG TPA: hypothetical protein VF316_02890 [Polyangiaceae bacterium]
MRKLAAAFVVVLGCGGHGDGAGAVVTAVSAVAAAGVNRAVTKDCWGQCLGGLVCDRESGVCVKRPPCGGVCKDDETCDDTGATERGVRKEGSWWASYGAALDAGDAE